MSVVWCFQISHWHKDLLCFLLNFSTTYCHQKLFVQIRRLDPQAMSIYSVAISPRSEIRESTLVCQQLSDFVHYTYLQISSCHNPHNKRSENVMRYTFRILLAQLAPFTRCILRGRFQESQNPNDHSWARESHFQRGFLCHGAIYVKGARIPGKTSSSYRRLVPGMAAYC